MNSTSNIIIDDFESIIKIDARGEIIKVYKHVLLQSTYFQHILGCSEFAGSKPQLDGSYFIDCDADVFRELLAYIEFGRFRTCMFSPKYLKNVGDKFGVNIEIIEKKKNITSSSSLSERVEERTIAKSEKFRENLLNFLSDYIKEKCETHDFFEFDLEFYRSDIVEFKKFDNKLVCMYSHHNIHFISTILKSKEILEDMINPIIPFGRDAAFDTTSSFKLKSITLIISKPMYI